MGHRVLVIDDEPRILKALGANLGVRGYDVALASSGEEGLALASTQAPDAVILDLGLPGIGGLDVITGLRKTLAVPIIVLSVRGEEYDKVGALDAGADDYVTKPFAMGELLARLRAALRRPETEVAARVITTDDFTLDLAGKRASRDGADIRMTPTEWHIVELLVRHRGQLVSQQRLLREVWGPEHEHATNYLRVYLAQLRRKLEPDPTRPRYFITEPGLGYRLEA